MATLMFDGRNISYLDAGEGEPAVVFVHGYPFAAEQWQPQIDTFSGVHRCVAPDLYGFGGSDCLPGKGDYSIAAYADQVAGVVDILGLDSVVLAGLSMGGYIALNLAARRPGWLRALVLADTRSEADTPEGAQRRSDQQVFLSGNGDPGTLADGLLGTIIGERTPGRDEVCARVRQMMLTSDRKAWVGALEAMRTRPDVTGTLGDIGVPTLVVVGEDDKLTPPPVAEGLTGAIKGAQLQIIPAAGHVSNLENPSAFNGVLGAFLERL